MKLSNLSKDYLKVLNLVIIGLPSILSKWYMTGGEQLKF